MAQKVENINKVVATLAQLTTGFLQRQVEKKVDHPLANKGISLIFPLANQVIVVLSDKNPDNSGQVRDEVLDWVNEPLANFLEEVFADLIAKQESPDAKALLTFLGDTFVKVLRIYSDDDQENKEQIAALWEDTISKEKTHKLITDHIVKPLLVKAKASEAWQGFVINMFATTLTGLTKAGKETEQ